MLVDGTAMVGTASLIPQPKVDVVGATFTIEAVPDNSAFQIVAVVAPTHRRTINETVEITDSDLAGVKAFAVAESQLAAYATAFGTSSPDTAGTVFLKLVDAQGNPKANVAGSNILITGVTGAPKFLDASLAAAPALTASSASGWAVIFNVPPGVLTLGTPATATATLVAPSLPVGANAVTLVRATVTDGNMPPPLPTNVSFATNVVPIFSKRGCVACHSGNGPGKDLGGLQLDGGVQKVYKELVVEDPTRVTTATPEKSLVLTMPSAESPSDPHPNVTFTGPQDPDYLTILVWIREGAKNN
jgi:hypothetical protein